jgi:hypothetical protein
MFMRYNAAPALTFHIKQQEFQEKLKIRKNFINSLPLIQYKQKDAPEVCPICLEPYNSHEELKVLPCLHNYHPQCITQWLLTHIRCPVCKSSIIDGKTH